jgi:nicotinate-nucleotide adenylyltransferase
VGFEMKKIGLFGGTFDPIHFGHIHLALQLLEKHRLDEVFFCVAVRSPFKKKQPPFAPPLHRLEMTRLATRPISAFHVCDIELKRPAPSYTVDTLRDMHDRADANTKFYLLLSDEVFDCFHCWKEANEIVRLAKPLVGVRFGTNRIPPSAVQPFLRKGLTKTGRLDISSTDIRNRLQKKLYCGHLAPLSVLRYIKKELLYTACSQYDGKRPD